MITDEQMREAFEKIRNASFPKFLRDNYPEVGIKWEWYSFKEGCKIASEQYQIETEELQKRLDEAVKIITCLAFADANAISATQIYINTARQFLAKNNK